MILRRIASALAVMFGITVLVFTAVRFAPGDPIATSLSRASISNPEMVAKFRVEYGLDQPIPVQFVAWLGHVVVGDFGSSVISGEPVASLLWRRFAATALLGVVAALLAFSAGIAWGVATARLRGVIGGAAKLAPLLGIALPSFSIGLGLSFVFSVAFRILPSSGIRAVLGGGDPLDVLAHLVLPAITLAVFPAAVTARITQASLEELQHEDFVRTAQAAGIPAARITFRHTLPNALLPVITSGGVLAGYILTGAIFVETVFGWPGIGTLMVASVLNRDYPVVEAGSLVVAATYVSLSLLADLLYTKVDPRISYQRSSPS